MKKNTSSSTTQSSSTSNESFSFRVGKRLRRFYLNGGEKSPQFSLELFHLLQLTARNKPIEGLITKSALGITFGSKDILRTAYKGNLERQRRLATFYLSLPLDGPENIVFDLYLQFRSMEDVILRVEIVPSSAHSAELRLTTLP